jgi:hypothetical protein
MRDFLVSIFRALRWISYGAPPLAMPVATEAIPVMDSTIPGIPQGQDVGDKELNESPMPHAVLNEADRHNAELNAAAMRHVVETTPPPPRKK